MLDHSGATAVRFHTHILSDEAADQLHAELGELVPALDVILGGDDGAAWVGAIAPVDSSPSALEALMERLRADARIQSLTVAVGRLPM